jgi:hypothetical protein
MMSLRFRQCPRDTAMFTIGIWRTKDWAVYAFLVDDETDIGTIYQLYKVAKLFGEKYGITGEGEMG